MVFIYIYIHYIYTLYIYTIYIHYIYTLYIYIYIQYIYIECHNTCKDCNGEQPTNCINCYEDRIHIPELTACTTSCPNNFYKYTPPTSTDNICLKCAPPCTLCNSLTNCSSCSPGYYLVRGEYKCVLPQFCPSGTFPMKETRTCDPCYYTCETCSGGEADQCIVCKYVEGYVKKFNQYVSSCIKLFCSQRYYEKILEGSGKHICDKCHDSCQECSGAREFECLKCPSGKMKVITLDGINCIECEALHVGYISNPEDPEKCSEICGDGRNMGIFQCDDGNLVDGDGCNRHCTIESGFECSGGGKDLPDQCIDIVQPVAHITSIDIHYQMTISFTKLMQNIGNIYIIYIYSP